MAMTSLSSMSETRRDISSVNEGSTTTSVQAVVKTNSASIDKACNADANGKHVQTVETNDVKTAIVDDTGGMFTFKNILIGTGGLVALLILFVLLRNMIRVR